MKDFTNIRIKTERLFLRNLQLDDISQDYIDWLNDPEINKYLSSSNSRQTLESCQQYVMSYQQNDDAALIGVFLKDNGVHIGNLTFVATEWRNKTTAIGIAIGRKECMGKGFAVEALSAAAKYCFETLGFNRLYARVNVQNIRALGLFLNSGFRIEGILRKSDNIDGEFQDSYMVSLLKTDL